MKALLCLLLAGCLASDSTDDVTGPFTGASHRFEVDGFALPINSDTARQLGDDLNGDKTADNQAGSVIGTLSGQHDITTNTSDMIASGVLRSHVEILADDLISDDHAGVLYFGADGDDPTPVGGRFQDGVLISNRTRVTRAPGRARIELPVFRDADPVELVIDGMEIDLVPDGAGYLATIHGAIQDPGARTAAFGGILQMVNGNPSDHLRMYSIFDAAPRDGKLTMEEMSRNGLFIALMSPDVDLFDGTVFDPTPNTSAPDSLSIGFQVHLSPTLAGDPPADTCHDRIRDGDETDIDCGGSCRACAGGFSCAVATDCETAGCDGGTCRTATCTDGKRDGFESDVDCGGACAAVVGKGCAPGQHCEFDGDCFHGVCDGQTCVHTL